VPPAARHASRSPDEPITGTLDQQPVSSLSEPTP
jgi:hypothetical protein